jgi:hypothetical protein
MMALVSRSAMRMSYSLCRFNQKRDSMPKNSPRRSVVSATIGRLPFTSSLMRLGDERLGLTRAAR